MKKFLLYIILIFLASKAFAQYIPIDEQKAKLIWDIQKYLIWENDIYLDRIVLGTYKCPKDMLDALEKYKPSKFVTGINYQIINYQTLDQIKKYCHGCQLFYIPEEENDKVRQIFQILAPYSTVIITDEWYDKENLMINLFVESSGQQVNFEYNAENIMNHGVSLVKDFDKLGGIDLNAKKLLRQTKKELAKVEQNLKQKELELQEKMKQVEEQKQKIQQQTAFIKKQEQIIAQRQAEIQQQKARLQALYKKLIVYQNQLQNQIKLLKEKEQEIEYSKRQLVIFQKKIHQQQQKFNIQKQKLKHQEQLLKQIEIQMEQKKRELKRLNFTVTMQRLALMIFLVLLIIIAILSYFIYKSYKVQKQQNIILRQQKEEIEAQAEQLEKLSVVASETSNAVAIMYTNGDLEWINAGFTKLYGYTLQMLNNIFDGNITNFNPALKHAISTCIKNKTSVTVEAPITTRLGQHRWVQSTITPIINDSKISKLILIDSDITRIKEAEEEIRRKNEQILKQAKELERKNFELAKLSIVAEHTDNGVIIADSNGKIEWVNPGFERMLQMSFEEFKKHFGDNIIFANLPEQTIKLIQNAIQKHQSAEYIFSIKTPNNKLLWLRSTLTPMFDKNGQLLKLFSINADITEIKLAQEKIEKQNRDITKSIQYAKRIQQAALPPKDLIDKLLPNNFILYLPRDIVSGDFYWVTKIRNKILFTAADCTGHGVPGAFMSMLGIAFLNEIVGKIDYEQLQPNLILNILRQYVIRFLKQEADTSSSKDGMDMALCMLDTRTEELHFSGANNPMWLVRNGQLMEFAPDDMPIGIYYNAKESFTNHSIKYEPGDIIYIFSDGYADQFGGPRNKKFMIKRMRQLIIEISSLPMEEQKQILLKTHLEWKGNNKQLDDILVMGVKL